MLKRIQAGVDTVRGCGGTINRILVNKGSWDGIQNAVGDTMPTPEAVDYSFGARVDFDDSIEDGRFNIEFSNGEIITDTALLTLGNELGLAAKNLIPKATDTDQD